MDCFGTFRWERGGNFMKMKWIMSPFSLLSFRWHIMMTPLRTITKYTLLTCETRHTFLQQQRSGAFPTYQPLHEILFTFSASPRASATGCVRQTTASQSHHNKGNQPPTHLRASIQFPCTSRTDLISTKLTAGSEWNLRQEEEFLFF